MQTKHVKLRMYNKNKIRLNKINIHFLVAAFEKVNLIQVQSCGKITKLELLTNITL